MKEKQRIAISFAAVAAILVLIFDARSALSGADAGIQLCLYTVIPSLFPFIVFSVLLNSTLLGNRIKLLQPLIRHLGIPAGSESLLLLGLVGGYPVGAQCVHTAFKSGYISRRDAEHLLSFCNNAGPAFIFGLTTSLFSAKWTGWIIWGIQIISALLTGALLSTRERGISSVPASAPIKLTQAVMQSARIVASICCWVVLFRVLIATLDHWFLWRLPQVYKSILCGILELTNGCMELSKISSDSSRLILVSSFLSAGGLCVAMQTAAVVPGLSMRRYYLGKLLQTALSCLIASITQYLCCQESNPVPLRILLPLCCGAASVAMLILFIISKIDIAFQINV